MGAEVNIKEPSSHLFTNEWMGIAVCAIYCSVPHYKFNDIIDYRSLSCQLIVNGNGMRTIISCGPTIDLSDDIWLLYVLKEYFEEEGIKLLKECEANEFSQIGIKIKPSVSLMVKKCGFRLVYKKDIEDLNQTMAQSSITSIIPYEDLDVHNHNFNNSAVVVECNQAKRTCDDYDGVGPSGEGSSNDVPHPKRIERLLEDNSDCAESSE